VTALTDAHGAAAAAGGPCARTHNADASTSAPVTTLFFIVIAVLAVRVVLGR
jgi:hypothetical protein